MQFDRIGERGQKGTCLQYPPSHRPRRPRHRFLAEAAWAPLDFDVTHGGHFSSSVFGSGRRETMEREREKGARGGDDIILHFLAVRSRTGARRTRAREGSQGRRKRGQRKGSEGTNSYGPPFVPRSAAERRPGAFRTPWSGMEPWNAAVRRAMAAVQVTQQMEPKKG